MSRLSPQLRAFLEEKRFAVLATINPDSTPQQSVVWYELQGDEIMMNTARGRLKERNLRRDPRASICLEAEYAYLTLTGPVVLIDDQAIAQADIKRLSERYHDAATAERQVRDQYSKEHRVTVRMRIERIVTYGFDR
jgi:PPOX class probable F420-dependent enzyme